MKNYIAIICKVKIKDTSTHIVAMGPKIPNSSLKTFDHQVSRYTKQLMFTTDLISLITNRDSPFNLKFLLRFRYRDPVGLSSEL